METKQCVFCKKTALASKVQGLTVSEDGHTVIDSARQTNVNFLMSDLVMLVPGFISLLLGLF